MSSGLVDQETLMRLLVREVPRLALRAVAVPTKQLGTVERFYGATALVVLDGDVSPVTIQVAVPGGVWPAQRVVVDFYPPHGAVVSGVLTGSPHGETIMSSGFSVASAAGSSTSPTSWTVESQTDGHWTTSGGVLTCGLPGWWDVNLRGTFATGPAGTVRALRIVSSGAAGALTGSNGGGGSTTGYGVGLNAAGPMAMGEDETLTVFARQDSGGPLNLDVVLHMRWIGPET